MENTSGKTKFIFLLLGIISGSMVGAGLLGAGLWGYQYYKKGTRYDRSISSELVPSEKLSQVTLKIYPKKGKHKINPMIYGSNLSAKMEFEMDVVKLGKDLGISNFRYPGGGSDGYHWREGKFDYEGRVNAAPLANFENVIKYIDLTGSKLVIQVNIESGTAQEAAEWVDYLNNKTKKRVDYWELGNEVYGDWDKAYMPAEQYADVIKEYAQAMKAVDPTIKIGANFGGPNYINFDEGVMKLAADHFDFISFHWYPNHINPDHPYQGRTHPLPEEVMANSHAIPQLVQYFHKMVERHAPQRHGKIEVGFLEWDGSWDAVASDLKHEYRGLMWSLTNAIFYADAIGQFVNAGVDLAHQFTFQEVMFGMIPGWDKQAGWGGNSWDKETIRPKALAFKLFAKYFGDTLIESELTGSPSYQKSTDDRADSYSGEVPYVTAYASKFSNDHRLAIILINKHNTAGFKVALKIPEVKLKSEGRAFVITGEDLETQNDGQPRSVELKSFKLTGVSPDMTVTLAPRSIKLLQITEDLGEAQMP